MYSIQSSSKNSCSADVKSVKRSVEGRLYEKLTLTLLAKRGYELSKDVNSKFGHFSIGREIDIGGKFDGVIFRYEDKDNKNNLIFAKIKHKANHYDYQINSRVLSSEPPRENGVRDGGMNRDFNLEKYFFSYLRARDELNSTTSKELKNGRMKYVVIFTNIGFDTAELIDSGFSLRKAPYDIINLFSFIKPLPEKDDSNHCYQFGNVSESLRKTFKRSSDLHRLARELAKYVVWENYREKKIMKIDEAPMRYYHVALMKEVIEKSEVINKSHKMMNKKNELYCEAKFNDDFLRSNKTGTKKELRDAIFEAIRELDISKRDTSDGELGNILRGVNLKVPPNFGKGKKRKMNLPDKWMKIEEDDIADFLKCLVFLVNQPDLIDLLNHINQLKEGFSQSCYVRQPLDEIYPIFRDRIEKEFGIYNKTSFKEMWLSREQIEQFVREILEEEYDIHKMNLIDEYQVMRYGMFTRLGKLISNLKSFLGYVKGKQISEDVQKSLKVNRIFCICTPVTLLTTVKIVDYLNSKNHRIQFHYIPIEIDNLKYEKITDHVKKVFETNRHNLFIIECRQTNENVVKETCGRLFDTIIRNHCKGIILISMKNVADLFKCYLKNFYKGQSDSDKIYVEETDDINLKDFVPKENPLTKQVIVFQGQEEKVRFATLTGICNWNFFINYYLFRERFLNTQDIVDLMILILNNDKVEIGSQPLGTSSLEGAYATLFEEISIETLANRLLMLKPDDNNNHSLEDTSAELLKLSSQGIDNNNDIYIMTGIKGSSKEEKIDILMRYFDFYNELDEIIANQFGDIGSDSKIQIAGDQIKDEDFKRICCSKPEKRIFWIDIKYDENGLKFILRHLYNPKFYLNRNFKQVIAMKEIKEKLIEKCLSEIFIFCCVENEQVLIDSLKFSNESEKEQFKKHCKTGEIKFFTEESDAKAEFYELCKHNKVVHFLKFINKDLTEIFFIKEHDLIKEIKDKKVAIIAGDPGMGKTTFLSKLYESKNGPKSFIETHWIISINLKDHSRAIRDINLVNGVVDVVSVVRFLSTVDIKLNHNLAKILMVIALDKGKTFPRPLLLAFDGFDEVLDVDDRIKIISLFKFLKQESAAKIWITTSLRYKKTLENELSTFAFEFDPNDDDFVVAYIKQYLKDRLCLSEKKIAELFIPDNGMLFVRQYLEDRLCLSEKQIAEIFVRDNKRQKTIQMFAAKFLEKLKSVFTGNISRFIGTPLQLHLMLDGSERHFKKCIEKDEFDNVTFDYLGGDICKVYEKFIHRKYEVYFEKIHIRECVRQKTNTFILDQYNEDLAMSLILGEEPKNAMGEFKDSVLSSGIIKSHGNNIYFIHATFREFFAASVFVKWIKKIPSVVSNSLKKEYILKEILLKPNYQLIRCFINVKLKNVMETKKFEECLKHCGMVMEKLLGEEASPLIGEKGTVLHIAAAEGNKNIVWFLLESLKRHTVVLQKFLFIPDKYKRTALHTAVAEGNIHITSFMLNSLKGHTDVLKKFLFFPDKDKRTALHLACRGNDVKIVKFLLDAAVAISEDTLQEFLYTLNDVQENTHNRDGDEIAKLLLLDITDEISKLLLDGETERLKGTGDPINVQRNVSIASSKKMLSVNCREVPFGTFTSIYQEQPFKSVTIGARKFCPLKKIEGRSLHANIQYKEEYSSRLESGEDFSLAIDM